MGLYRPTYYLKYPNTTDSPLRPRVFGGRSALWVENSAIVSAIALWWRLCPTAVTTVDANGWGLGTCLLYQSNFK